MLCLGALLLIPSCLLGQPPGGPGGPGGADVDLLEKHDADGNGTLDTEERAAARKEIQELSQRGGRRGGGRRGGRGRITGKPGPKVSPSDVENYPDAELYDPKVLRTVFLQFEADDWEKELADFKPSDVEVPATMTVDGKEYPNVGVSFRGASSFFMIPEGSKRSLNISMDYMDDDQKLYGYKSLNFLNGNGDASMMSSVLYSEFAGQNIPTPKVNFVKVVINGRSWGIYSNAEQFNKDFINEHFETRKGARWKVLGNPRGDGGLRYLGDDFNEYRSRFEIKSKDKDESWQELINLCKVLNETPDDKLVEALDPILNIDGVLWFLAYDVAFINSDGYWTRASDYSIYKQPDGKFQILPHDMNESFRAMHRRGGGPGGRGGGPPGGGPPGGGFGGPPGGGPPGGGFGGPPGGPEQGGGEGPEGFALDPLVGVDSERFPLRSRLLSIPELRQKYLQNLRTIASKNLNEETFAPLVESMRELIVKEIKADTRKLMTNDAFEAATNRGKKATGVNQFARERSKFLLEHPAIKELK
jgi:spore coat protein CotH